MNAATPPDHDPLGTSVPPDSELVRRFCTLLIGAGRPLETATIAHLLHCGSQELEAAAQPVGDRLAAVGVTLLRLAGKKWMAAIEAEGSAILAKLSGKTRTTKRLSPEAAETLAFIQENGGATLKAINTFRQKDSRSALATLLELELIGVSGRAKRQGGAKLYTSAVTALVT